MVLGGEYTNEALSAHAEDQPRGAVCKCPGFFTRVCKKWMEREDYRGVAPYLLEILPWEDCVRHGYVYYHRGGSRRLWLTVTGKVGMSVLTKGLAMDFVRQDRKEMAITSIWPAVVCLITYSSFTSLTI